MRSARRRALGIFVALALLACGAALFFDRSRAPQPDALFEAHAAQRALAVSTPNIGSRTLSREADGAPAREAELPAAEIPQALGEAAPPRAAESHWLLRVLRDDGLPAVGLEVRNGRPVSDLGMHAEQWFEHDRIFPAFYEDPAASHAVFTDATGLARIPLHSADQPLRCAWIRTPDGNWSRTVRENTVAQIAEEDLLVFGTAQLAGTAYQDDGSPRSSWPILARQQAPRDELPLWLGTFTDERGAYTLGLLAAGGRRVVVQPWTSDLESVSLSLSQGEVRALDFGSPRGWMYLNGQLQWPSGSPLDLPARLFFSGAAQRTEHVPSGGSFEMRIPSGVYRVRLGSRDGALLAELQLDEPRRVEWALPSALLRGGVRYAGTKHTRASGPENEAVIHIARAGDEVGARTIPALRGPGQYAFCALEPGSYELSCDLWPLSLNADGRVRVDVTAADTELVLDLELHDR